MIVMIFQEKLPNALYALQQLLVYARFISGDPNKSQTLFRLLDYAEYLPYLIASDVDETEQFHAVLIEIAQSCSCTFVLQGFEGDMPPGWRS